MSEKKVYKYNMTLYYQSIFLYLIGLIIYFLLKAQFTMFDFSILKGDGIFYSFLIIIGYTLLSTIFNLLRRKNISFTNSGFIFTSRIRKIKIDISEIADIKIIREHNYHFNGILRTVKIKFLNKKKVLILRPIDYENEMEVLEEFKKLRDQIELRKKENLNVKEF